MGLEQSVYGQGINVELDAGVLVQTGVTNHHAAPVLHLSKESVIISFLAAKIGSVRGTGPDHKVLFPEMPGKEEVSPKYCGVSGKVSSGAVEVSAVLNGAGQVEVTLEIVFEHSLGADPLPVEHIVQRVTV